jgi:tRNA dimethylallyltransferase
MSHPYRTVAVCGPTASGKTALSLELAQQLNGEVVNVDSVQVYRELEVGSAKLAPDARVGVPHHVLDIFSPDRQAHVADFRAAALAALDDIVARGSLPILVGGSGMYLTALLHGLAELPSTPSDVRTSVATLSTEQQYQELQRVDPVTAGRLNPNDRQRISRAVEVYRITGKPASDFHAQHAFMKTDVASLVLVLCRPRDELYRRIDQRSEAMVNQGLLAETEALLARYGRVPVLETLGYKQACDCLEGRLQESNLVREIAMHTRRFAKRQMTYWRNEPSKRGWLVRPTESEEAEEVAGFDEFPARAQQRMKGFRAFTWSAPEIVGHLKSRLTSQLDRTEVWYVRV